MANIDDTIGLPNSHPAIEYRQTRTIRRPAWHTSIDEIGFGDLQAG
jgi:hypothetical protein